MVRTILLVGLLIWCAVPAAASDATMLRVFLADGTSFVSYGEFARLDDRVVFSMLVGGSGENPRLHVMSIPAQVVDWPRTDRYSASARYHQYAASRGEEDFIRLSNDVARVLTTIGLTSDPAKALQIATQARQTMAEWPARHYGYRQKDVREIVALLDEAVSDLRVSAGLSAFDVSLVANVADVPLEPLLRMPTPPETLGDIERAAQLTDRSADRISLLESGLLLLHESEGSFGVANAVALRKSIEGQVREERLVDQRYTAMAGRLLARAQRGASHANVRQVESALLRIPNEDEKLGRRRPDVVQALQASVQMHLTEARQLRLQRDRWTLRRSLYRDYQRAVAVQMLQIVKAQPILEAIRRLDGPGHAVLTRWHARFSGGATQLQRITHPEDLGAAHEMLVGAWRLAEQAIQTRRDAIASGSLETAWAASSAAAGSLMLLSNAQHALLTLLEPPRLK